VHCGVGCQVMRHPLMVALSVVLLIAAGTQCVAAPDVMRRDHPSLLKHQRDETVHRGVREARASLKACIGCHASAATGSVAQAKTDFCSSCHGYAAVQIDCFECHSSKAQRTAALAGAGKP
jgi:hypothetical protein